MPRRLLRAPGHDRERSLGWLAVWWMEKFTLHGPGDVEGEPMKFGDEFTGFFVDCYALDTKGRRLYDSVFFSRPKGCNKSGVGACLCLFEALGPARFLGWAKGGEAYTFLGETYEYLPGEPMGRPVKSPFVRVMATEEEQAGNVYDTVFYNLTDDNAPLAQLKAYGLDAGLTRTKLPFGGEIVPSTSGAASKDGGKETFGCFDESHLYNTPVLRRMYGTVTRNLVKRKKLAEPWCFEPTTMFAPGEDSIAEETYKLADAIEAGKARRHRLLFDHRWGDPPLDDKGSVDLTNEEKLVEAIEEAFGDAMAWNSVEGVMDKMFDPRQSESESIRYFLNSLIGKTNAWIQPSQWSACRVDDNEPAEMRELQPGDVITLGFDGSLTDDATALVACRVKDRLLVPLRIDEKPDTAAAKNWEVDQDAFDAEVARAFAKYKVVAFFADPPYWQDRIDKWLTLYGEKLLLKSSVKHPIYFWTKLDGPMATALERMHTAIALGIVRHPGHAHMTGHFLHAQVWKRAGGNVIGKESKGSDLKIDAAMAATLAYEAAAQYETRGKKPEKAKAFSLPRRIR